MLQLDLDNILRSRMSRTVNRLVPRAATRMLENIVHQTEMNEILRYLYPTEGSEFARGALEYMNITTTATGLENLQPGHRYIFASNHPLGGLDGISLIALLGGIYGDDHIYFLVNDLLMNITPLSPVFLPINKYGSQGREAARAITEAYNSEDKQIIIFPAGLVSRKQKGGIRDLEWKKAFVQKALQSNREIVPVHFVGLNSSRFYNTARWRKRLRIPFNVEQVLLPSEMLKARGAQFEIRFGKPIPVSELQDLVSSKGLKGAAEQIKHIVYEL